MRIMTHIVGAIIGMNKIFCVEFWNGNRWVVVQKRVTFEIARSYVFLANARGENTELYRIKRYL